MRRNQFGADVEAAEHAMTKWRTKRQEAPHVIMKLC